MRRQNRRKLFVESLEARDVPAFFAVAPTGNDTTGTGSAAAPYLTLQKAVNVANSGDTVLVAGGTYTYDASQETIPIQQLATKQVVTIFNENVNIIGGYSVADGFRTANPAMNPVIIDGQNSVRGLQIVGINQPTGGTIQGITFRNGLGTPLSVGTSSDKVFAFGGGAFINMGSSQQDQTPIVFRDVLFENNKAIGLAGIPTDPIQNFGGGGAGGALEVRFANNVTIENAIFRNNLAQGGPGNDRGGVAPGGALHLDNSKVTATNLLFDGNQALSGHANAANAVGIPNSPGNAFTSDATGGAIAVQINSVFDGTNITAINNTAVGGNADRQAGDAYGGAIFAEISTVTIRNGLFSNNIAQGGVGDDGSSGGGAIHTDRGNTTLDRVKFLNNRTAAGNLSTTGGVGILGAAGGGAIRTTTSTTQPNRNTIIRNSVIANNSVLAGLTAPAGAPGAAAAVWLQGVNATIEHTTIANNAFDPKLSFGEAIILLNDGAATQTVLNMSFSTMTGHDLVGSDITLFRGTTVNLNKNLFANISTNGPTFSEPLGGGPSTALGVVNGSNTTINGANPLYTSPNATNFDYSIKAGSPVIDGATGSTVSVDISNAARTGTADIGAFEFGTAGTAPTIVAATGANVTTGPAGFTGTNQAPTITAIANPPAVTVGTILSKVNFTIADPDTPVGNLQLIVGSSNPALVPAANVVFTGTGGSKVAEINAIGGVTGSSTITITVSDGAGGAANSTFTVTVNPVGAVNTAPTITDIANQAAVTVGTAIAPIAFTIGDAETPTTLTVTATSNNATLVPNANVTFGGTGTAKTVTVAPAAGQTGTATITVTVQDAGGLTATDTFTVTVNPVGNANTAPTISDIPNQATVTVGTAIAPIAFTIGDAETPTTLTVVASSSNTALVPNAAVSLGGTGTAKTVTVAPASGQTGTSTITVTVTDAGGLTATDTFTVTVNPIVIPGTPNPILVNYPQFGVGADVGGGTATLFNPDKTPRYTVTPFAGFTGGVRTAAADFNSDGIAELVVGTGPGRATRVRVLDGVTQAELFGVDAFEASFTGGVYVIAGDVSGDGIPDLAITPDEGGGPRVDIYSGVGFGKIASFFGIDDPNFRGGARAAIADISGDGRGDLIVVAGFGGGPRVAGFDGKSLGGTPTRLFGDFFAFEQTLRNGIFVAAGDVNGDGMADLVAGGGPGGGPRVTVFDAKNLLLNQQVQVANFFGGDSNSRGGIRVSVKNLDNDSKADVVVGAGSGAGSRVTSYLGANLATGNATPGFDFDAIAGFAGGVFVG